MAKAGYKSLAAIDTAYENVKHLVHEESDSCNKTLEEITNDGRAPTGHGHVGGETRYDVSFNLLSSLAAPQVADILSGRTPFPTDPKAVHDSWPPNFREAMTRTCWRTSRRPMAARAGRPSRTRMWIMPTTLHCVCRGYCPHCATLMRFPATHCTCLTRRARLIRLSRLPWWPGRGMTHPTSLLSCLSTKPRRAPNCSRLT